MSGLGLDADGLCDDHNRFGCKECALSPTSEVRKYAVAVTMTRDIPNGTNILTRLNTYEAVSMDEAVGKAVCDACEGNPDHSVFQIAKMDVSA